MTTERTRFADGTMYVEELDDEGRVVRSRAYGETIVVFEAAAEKRSELPGVAGVAGVAETIAALEAEVARRPATVDVPIDIDDIRFLTLATEILKRQPPQLFLQGETDAKVAQEIDAFRKLVAELPPPTKTKRGPQLSKREMRQRQMQHNRRGGR